MLEIDPQEVERLIPVLTSMMRTTTNKPEILSFFFGADGGKHYVRFNGSRFVNPIVITPQEIDMLGVKLRAKTSVSFKTTGMWARSSLYVVIWVDEPYYVRHLLRENGFMRTMADEAAIAEPFNLVKVVELEKKHRELHDKFTP
jgi:hypothetical protein